MFKVQTPKVNQDNLENRFNELTYIYRNESEIIQIIRISQTNNAFFERVVFPNQCIQFSASVDAVLEVCEGVMAGSIYSDTIPCYQLAIATGINMKQNFKTTQESTNDCQHVLAIAV